MDSRKNFRENQYNIFPSLVRATKTAQAARLLPCIRLGPCWGIDWETECCC